MRHEGGTADIDIQQNLICQSAGDEALTEFPLRLIVRIEQVGIAGTVRVVTVDAWIIVNPARARARHDGLELPDLTVLQCVRYASESVGEAPCEGEFVQWMDPIGGVVE